MSVMCLTPADLARLKSLCARMGQHDIWSIDDIAAARDAVPELLEMVEQLTAGVQQLSAAGGEAGAYANEMKSLAMTGLQSLKDAEARAERAEAALQWIIDYCDRSDEDTIEMIERIERKARAILAMSELPFIAPKSKKCVRCNKTKPAADFRFRSAKASWASRRLHSWCIECKREHDRIIGYRKSNP